MLLPKIRLNFGCSNSVSFKLRVLSVPFYQQTVQSVDRGGLLVDGGGVDVKGFSRLDVIDSRTFLYYSDRHIQAVIFFHLSEHLGFENSNVFILNAAKFVRLRLEGSELG